MIKSLRLYHNIISIPAETNPRSQSATLVMLKDIM